MAPPPFWSSCPKNEHMQSRLECQVYTVDQGQRLKMRAHPQHGLFYQLNKELFSLSFRQGQHQPREKRGMCKAANTEVKKQFLLPHPVPL